MEFWVLIWVLNSNILLHSVNHNSFILTVLVEKNWHMKVVS